MRTRLIKIVTFLGGIYFFLKFVLPEKIALPGGQGTFSLGAYNDQISTGLLALVSMALGLGLVNLVMRHGATIVFLRTGWIQSVALLFGLITMLLLSGLEWRSNLKQTAAVQPFFMLREFSSRIEEDEEAHTPNVPHFVFRKERLIERVEREIVTLTAKLGPQEGESPAETALRGELLELSKELRATLALFPSETAFTAKDKELLEKLKINLGDIGTKMKELLSLQHMRSVQKKIYTLFFQGVFVSLGSAMFSLLGFYIASAAYRAFRVRSAESGLMMGAALLVILGQIPFMLFGSGPWGTYLHHLFPEIRLWLLTVPNAAAFRAIEIGAAVGVLIMGFRMWFSIESESFSEKERSK